MKRGKPPKRKAPLRRISKKRLIRLASEPLRPRKPIARRGKRAWSPSESAGVGICAYRGSGPGWQCSASDRPGPLTWDHTVNRSLNPGPMRDDPRLLVKTCAICNSMRKSGYRPPWSALPKVTRDLILELNGPVFRDRYFSVLDSDTS